MSACVQCGATRRRPAAAILPLIPLGLGIAAAIFVTVTKGRLAGWVVAAVVTVGFGVFLGVLVMFARSVLRGETCTSCGHRP